MNVARHAPDLDRRVWIIGASSGIGRALALEMASLGATVTASARNKEALDALASQSERIEPLLLDAAEEGALSAALGAMLAADSFPDLIIHLAAYYQPASIHKITPEDLERTIRVNLWSAIELARTALPSMYARQGGQLAFVASVAGYSGLPQGQPYSATKAALINFAESLRVEAKRKGVDIKLISPGFVETPMTDKNMFEMPHILTPEQAAKAIVKGLKTSAFEIHFPKKFTWKLKLLRTLPYWLYFKLVSKL